MTEPTQPIEEQAPVLPVSLTEAEKRTAAIRLAKMVRPHAQQGLTTLSKMIGRERNFLGRRLATGDVSVSVLVCLSWATHRNMFDSYLMLLPEDCRETALTRQLHKEIEELKASQETEKKETEKWKEKFEYADGLLRSRA